MKFFMKSLQTEYFQCMSPKFFSPTKQLRNCPMSGLPRPTKGNKCALSGMTMSWYSTSWIPALVTQKLKKMGPPGAVASHYLQMLPPLVSVVRRFFWTKILPTKEWKLPIFQLPNIWESGTLQPGIFHKIWLKFLQKKSPTKQTKQNKAEQSKAKQSKAKQS